VYLHQRVPTCALVMPSTVIRSFDYDAGRQELRVLFRSGRQYVYQDVPRQTFEAMKAAYSKGEFFNANIRDRFRFLRTDSSSGA
jgi:hypothetical protein